MSRADVVNNLIILKPINEQIKKAISDNELVALCKRAKEYGLKELSLSKSIEEKINILYGSAILKDYIKLKIKDKDKLLEGQNHFAELHLRTQKDLGNWLKEQEKAKGGEQYHNHPYISDRGGAISPKEETLEDMDITYVQSSNWQRIASIPEKIFENYINTKKEITTSGAVKLARKLQRESGFKGTPELPEGKYNLLYADPPWKYGDTLVEGYGSVERHYTPMTIQELCDLDIKNIVADNAVLFLWVTSPLLEECFSVIKAWGFKYKASFIWDKVKHNWGHYNSVRHEFLLICIKGTFLPQSKELHDSVISIERSKEHSGKPEYFRNEVIEKMYPIMFHFIPNKRCLVLKSPSLKKGWTLWGTQV